MKRWWLLGLFLVLTVFLGVGLTLNPREVPSPLIGKPAPHFQLPQLHHAEQPFSQRDLLGKVWLLNVWASWCASCRDEHAVLMDFSKSGAAPLYGLNYKDQRTDGIAWLKRFGDPYVLSAHDAQGRIGIDYGVYGVPETYVIDQQGVIRYKHIGPVTAQVLKEKILPLLAKLNSNV
jgi:cytochrome c biogenesis protein CcmG/thiol:disulfide interchange protein DsbE